MRTRTWITPLLVGALSVSACGDDKKDSSNAAAPVTTPTSPTSGTSASTAGKVLFQEPFDDDHNGWGVLADSPDGSIAYNGGDYVWAFKGSVAHWLAEALAKSYQSGELKLRDVVVNAQATVDAGGGVAGVFCRESPDTDADFQWYEFVARDGFAAIRRADAEANLDVLAETKDVSLPIGTPIQFEATCADDTNGHAQLSFSLNGTPVLHATDDNPLGSGVSGLQAWTFPVHQEMDIRWHDFSVHEAQG